MHTLHETLKTRVTPSQVLHDPKETVLPRACMQLKRTKWCSLLFLTMARKSRKNTMSGANWLL